MVSTVLPGGLGRSASLRNASNRSLSDAMSMASAEDPKMGILIASNCWDKFIAVCPPNCTTLGGYTSLSGDSIFSLSRISNTLSISSGSKYSLELVSKSVDTVSGLELTIILATFSPCSAQAACTLQ